MRIRYYITLFLLFVFCCAASCAYAGKRLVNLSGSGYESLVYQPDTIAVITAKDTMRKTNVFKKIYRYFADANKSSNKKFDVSVIGGPHYASDTKLGLGIVAAGVYSTNRKDSLTPYSNVSLFGDITTTGFYMLGVRGNNIFTREKWRIDYVLYFFSFPSSFWGVGFDNGNNDNNATTFLRLQAQVKADFMFRVSDRIYIGPSVSYEFSQGKDFTEKSLELLKGMDKTTQYASLGATLSYDSRDFIPNPYKGVFAKFTQRGYTGFSSKPFFSSTLILDYYQRVWKGAVLAFDFLGELQYGDVPWTMKSKLGGSYRMRGYYEGRYRDDNSFSLQMEYRQKIYNRHGIAVWAGCGTVWGKDDKFSWGQILPNYGIGYRWEFKKRMNVRLDYGFGKRGQSSFMFSINEAF